MGCPAKVRLTNYGVEVMMRLPMMRMPPGCAGAIRGTPSGVTGRTRGAHERPEMFQLRPS